MAWLTPRGSSSPISAAPRSSPSRRRRTTSSRSSSPRAARRSLASRGPSTMRTARACRSRSTSTSASTRCSGAHGGRPVAPHARGPPPPPSVDCSHPSPSPCASHSSCWLARSPPFSRSLPSPLPQVHRGAAAARRAARSRPDGPRPVRRLEAHAHPQGCPLGRRAHDGARGCLVPVPMHTGAAVHMHMGVPAP